MIRRKAKKVVDNKIKQISRLFIASVLCSVLFGCGGEDDFLLQQEAIKKITINNKANKETVASAAAPAQELVEQQTAPVIPKTPDTSILLAGAEPKAEGTSNPIEPINTPMLEQKITNAASMSETKLVAPIVPAVEPDLHAALVNIESTNNAVEQIKIIDSKPIEVTAIQERQNANADNSNNNTGNEQIISHIEAINLFRTENGLLPLRVNGQLTQSAQKYAEYMLEAKRFSHVGANGSTFVARITDTGYVYQSLGENIAVGQTSIPQVMTAWKNSPSHRKNLLDERFTEVGVGRAGNYWVQNFGKPR